VEADVWLGRLFFASRILICTYVGFDLTLNGSGRVGESGEMALTSRAYRLFHLTYPIAVLTLASLAPAPARADFFDDARRTFQTDIPHFFQDDIPCALGGQPTSHTKTSCKSQDHSAKHATDKDRDRAAERPDETPDVPNAPPSSGR
jgi:hypothetical protein